MRVPLFDLTRQYADIRPEVFREVESVLESGAYVLGPKVESFEKQCGELLGCQAVGMSSGTDALLAILMALEVEAGDAVITTPYTFFATAGCVHRVGAETVFVDIRPDTFNVDIRALTEYLEGCSRDAEGNLRTARGNRVRGIIPIHLFGACCEMDPLLDLARKYHLWVIEDAAQALGAQYPSREGVRHAGAIADYGYFSFFPSKNLGAFGDAGLSTCASSDFAALLRNVRNHGMHKRYYHDRVGGNFRIDALQAAVLLAKLPHLELWNARRRRNAALYREAFAAANLLDRVTLPAEPYADSGIPNHHIYHQYVIRAAERNELALHLSAKGIGHAIYYPVPLHLQDCFAYLDYPQGRFPVSEAAALETLALPIFPELTQAEIGCVVETIRDFYRR